MRLSSFVYHLLNEACLGAGVIFQASQRHGSQVLFEAVVFLYQIRALSEIIPKKNFISK